MITAAPDPVTDVPIRCWRASVFSLFPTAFPGILGHSLVGKASKQQIWQLDAINLRDFANNKTHRVDAKPTGGGPGMIIRPEVIAAALDSLPTTDSRPRIVLSPRGKLFTQQQAEQWASLAGLVLICGRYEGIDQRVIDEYQLQEISIGDYILAGGEVAAQVILETCIRLLPGTIGKPQSLETESLQNHLLEYPQYTKPRCWNGHEVPNELLSGNHRLIERWRRCAAEAVTKRNRPDLWHSYCHLQQKKQ